MYISNLGTLRVVDIYRIYYPGNSTPEEKYFSPRVKYTTLACVHTT